MKESVENSNVNAIGREQCTFCIMDLQVYVRRQVKVKKKAEANRSRRKSTT